ncbi:MAG: hypothetical protein HYU61_08270 [Brevundimonas diminuta]|uniref:hypothetical protein n=1 Tax=Brevundimonas diminuta TaxID=293 RepID=UPI000EEAD80E|nr:hypothetical protein [Brevundimonas diminuta]MBI2249795.1 hypothetical protein [Brevundimonas diminuta]HCQ53509.1 hypothetical protein [Brevundimonas diminuta]
MPAPRWLPILATLTMLTACDSSPETPETTPSAAVIAESFIAAAASIDATSLPALAAAVDADPSGVANQLQSGLGGRRALQAYAAAMLENGEGGRLGRQWATLTADVPALSASEQKDGGVWHPRAEDAGFFTGGIAAALSQNPKALPDFAQGAGVAPPAPGQDVAEWLSARVDALPRPARAAFDQALHAGAVR